MFGMKVCQNLQLKGKIDTTLFIKHVEAVFLLVQIYVDDLIFGAINEILCEEFSNGMQQEFEMSLMGELNFFYELQIKQEKDEIFTNQGKYARVSIKKFIMENSKEIAPPVSTSTIT